MFLPFTAIEKLYYSAILYYFLFVERFKLHALLVEVLDGLLQFGSLLYVDMEKLETSQDLGVMYLYLYLYL